MSEGLTQITIPDFDDDDYSSTPIPFGRTGFGTPSGQESPTATYFGDRSDRAYFHARGDSVTSEDSTQSIPYPINRTTATFAHSAHSSVTTASSSFTKKPSFASFKNAFKSGKTSDAPPVPALDRQVYPALKNPFSRSTSSLANPQVHSARRPSVTASPTPPRPPTPGGHSNEPRHIRGLSSNAKSKSHINGRSQYSVFTDNGSDNSHGFGHGMPRQSTPPPVPRMPEEYGTPVMRVGTPTWSDAEDKVVPEPQTPSDYAFHAIFMRFASTAESMLQVFLQQDLDHEPHLPRFLGPNVNNEFDDILRSLGRVAIKHPKVVIDSIRRWRKSQSESVGGDTIRYHSAKTQNFSRGIKTQETIGVLNERKSIGAVYIMCRALIVLMQSIPKDVVGEDVGHSLEEITFAHYRRLDLKAVGQSANHRINAELCATLLGEIANHRFLSVTDRFLAELGPVASGQVPKDLDTKYENLVKGLRHVHLKVWPPEAFEEGAEYMDSLAKCFENAHGFRFKTAFAETLLQLLHPIGKTAQAEVNHPLWAKAMEIIYGRAKNMVTKPRYWHVAYPLVIASLCVAPHEFFLRHWMPTFEAGLAKLKEKPYRIPIMNGMMRLIWTYLYRCHEPISTSTAKIDSLLKHFFPSNRLTIHPPEEHLDAFVYIVHFVLSRHFDFGRDLILGLLSEQAISSAQTGNILPLLGLERINIALEAVLLSLHLIEREEPTPSWPSNSDFSVLPNKSDYPSSSTFCPVAVTSKPGMQEFFDRCGATVTAIAVACSKSVGRMSIFDEQWSLQHFNSQNDDMSGYIIRQHSDVAVAYPPNLTPQIGLLHTCFVSWPRFLHSSLPLDEGLDMLIRGLVHVEPAIISAASQTLQQLATCPQHVTHVVFRFTSFLFSSKYITGEGMGMRLIYDTRLLSVWLAVVELWAKDIVDRFGQQPDDKGVTSVRSQLRDIEAAALFLLSFNIRHVRFVALRLIVILNTLQIDSQYSIPSPDGDGATTSWRIVDLLNGKGIQQSLLDDFDDALDNNQRLRLAKWRESAKHDMIQRLAESDDERDRALWRFVFPSFIRSCMNHRPDVLMNCREVWNIAISRYHPLIASVSGINNRLPTPQTVRSPGSFPRERDKVITDNTSNIEQWHLWVKLVCCTATSVESRPPTKREHSRAPSDLAYERERMTTTRGLFRYLTPFLDSDYSVFRETAVMCISSFPPDGYTQLLEDLNAFAGRHFYDSRAKLSSSPVGRRNRRQDRLYLAVAHIYLLTGHYLKEQRGPGRQDSLTIVLQFVRHTQAFLSTSELRNDWQQQRLRRYFCGIVECLFDGLATLQSSDRFIPPNMHLTLYRLCEEWCQCGTTSERSMQRLVAMQTAATGGFADPQQKAVAIERYQTETRLLSNAAVGAMASLIQKAFFPPETSSASPTGQPMADFSIPLDVVSTLDRILAMLASLHDVVNDGGRKALRSLLTHQSGDGQLLSDVMRRAFVTSREPNTSNCRFFEVVADVICSSDVHPFQFGHVVCLGLCNLCSALTGTREEAYNILQVTHIKAGGLSNLSVFEGAIKSAAPNIFLEAQRKISELLAEQHPSEAVHVFEQCSLRLPSLHELIAHQISSQILRSLLPWVADATLMDPETSMLLPDGRTYLYHFIALTLRYTESHPGTMQLLWSKLVDAEHAVNGQATIRFLLEQSSKIGSTAFVNCAKQIVALLSRTNVGQQIFEDLCGVMEPARMLPMIDHKLNIPSAEETDLLSDLDALFAEQPRHTLGTGQFALLFLTDVAPGRAWEFKKQLPTLLHVILAHIDHRNALVRDHARRLLFQTIRTWMPGYDELSDHSAVLSQFGHKTLIAELERDAPSMFWSEDDSMPQIHAKMSTLCSLLLNWFAPLHSKLAERWGSLALDWGTGCSIRGIAFRSLQIFRALMPGVSKADLALVLGRLSNTIADPEPNIQSFTAEIFLTLVSLAQHDGLEVSLLPIMFWCGYACLSTPVQTEFYQATEFMDYLLSRLDLDDPHTIDVLLSHQPSNWTDVPGLQSLLLVGMRSSVTSPQTLRLLQRFAKIKDSTFIDPSQNRARDMYTLSLPWCLRCMEEKSMDQSIVDYAEDIANFAEEEGHSNVARVMTSFVKTRFRTKDDFLRQAVVALRDHYAADHWIEVVSLLLGLTFNDTRWLRIMTMQILKMMFQLRETRGPVDRLGSELLMPLLRLLQTDLAPQALDVLEEPVVVSGGLAAKHVLRMSMHRGAPPAEPEAVTDVFGAPEASGWCIAQPERHRETCRANVMAVFDTCKVPTRPSRIDFEPEVEAFADALDSPVSLESDLGDMVQNLHELNTFFQDGQAKSTLPAIPSHQLEARVAAILAKSSDSLALDGTQTPLIDVFRAPNGGMMQDLDDSDEYSAESDYEGDAFAFDSMASPPATGRKGFF